MTSSPSTSAGTATPTGRHGTIATRSPATSPRCSTRTGGADATLVAMSLGGLNAIAFAATRPERVRGLVVVDVVPTVATAGKEAIGRQLAVHAFDTFDAAVEHARAFNPRRTVANIRERLHHAMRKDAGGRWTYKFDPAIGGAAGRDPESLWWAVGRLRCPTLLVRGAESNILTAEGAARFVRTVAGQPGRRRGTAPVTP